MIIEIYNILKNEGFDIEIGNGIIISKDGFKYSVESETFIRMCTILSQPDDSLVENDISMNGTTRTNRYSD